MGIDLKLMAPDDPFTLAFLGPQGFGKEGTEVWLETTRRDDKAMAAMAARGGSEGHVCYCVRGNVERLPQTSAGMRDPGV